MRRVRAGVEIDGKMIVPHEFRIVRETRDGVLLSVVLHEGMNRVVRRLLDAASIPITHLRRERVGPLSVAGIPRGAHRDLTSGELVSLFESLHLDRSAPDAESDAMPAPRETGATRHRARSRTARDTRRP